MAGAVDGTRVQQARYRTSPAPNAALSAPYYQPGFGWRPACTNRGFCQAGCSTGAKASMDVTFIPLAIGKGAELRTESFATEFETDAMGKISAVVYQRNGSHGAAALPESFPLRRRG
jgi:hypothetical protein